MADEGGRPVFELPGDGGSLWLTNHGDRDEVVVLRMPVGAPRPAANAAPDAAACLAALDRLLPGIRESPLVEGAMTGRGEAAVWLWLRLRGVEWECRYFDERAGALWAYHVAGPSRSPGGGEAVLDPWRIARRVAREVGAARCSIELMQAGYEPWGSGMPAYCCIYWSMEASGVLPGLPVPTSGDPPLAARCDHVGRDPEGEGRQDAGGNPAPP